MPSPGALRKKRLRGASVPVVVSKLYSWTGVGGAGAVHEHWRAASEPLASQVVSGCTRKHALVATPRSRHWPKKGKLPHDAG